VEQPRHGHRWLNIQRKERGQYPRVEANFLPMPCQHCQDAPCAKAAPDAVTIREDGVVLIDPVKSKGNKALLDSCPYGAIWWNDEKEVPQKCTFCAHLLDEGVWKMPRCTHSCPTGASQYYELDESEFEKKIASEGLENYLPELGTKGHVYYKNLYKFTKHFIAGAVTQNGEAAIGAKVSLKGASVPEQVTDFMGEFKFDRLESGEYTIVVNGNDVKTVTIDSSLNAGVLTI
jgi:Fe-S-cluster-containing dehydrogenase component